MILSTELVRNLLLEVIHMTTMENAEIMKTISELRKQVELLKPGVKTAYMQNLVNELDKLVQGLEALLKEA